MAKLLGAAAAWPTTLVLATLLLAPVAAPAANDGRAVGATAAGQAGRTLYMEKCAGCHGNTGAGNGANRGTATMPNFTTPGAVVTYDSNRMLASIDGKHSAEIRKSWGGAMAEAQARQIVAYIQDALMLPAITVDASRGRFIYAKKCSVCHGDRGDGVSFSTEVLSPPPRDFTSERGRLLTRDKMISAVTSGSPGTAMVGFATQLKPEEVAAVVDYIRSTFIFPSKAAAKEEPADEEKKK